MRELIANVVQHAKVPSAVVEIRREGEELVVIVEDHGVGFDAQAAQMQGTRGLAAVQACIEFLGGRVEIQTAPGSGSTVVLTVPTRVA